MDKENENRGIPTGFSHLFFVRALSLTSTAEFFSKVDKSDVFFKILGVSMCATYQVATCHRTCKGGQYHIFERLAAKAYNLQNSAFLLLQNGFYDESLGIVRTLGELANKISLSLVEPEMFQVWLNADDKTRRAKFSPIKVRILLDQHKETGSLIMNQEWYGDLSSKFGHIRPDVMPNMHGKNTAVAGGLYQENGVKKAIENLAMVSLPIAMMLSKRLDFEDFTEELRLLIDDLSAQYE